MFAMQPYLLFVHLYSCLYNTAFVLHLIITYYNLCWLFLTEGTTSHNHRWQCSLPVYFIYVQGCIRYFTIYFVFVKNVLYRNDVELTNEILLKYYSPEICTMK